MRRAAAGALIRIQQIIGWERCEETSAQFQEVARAIDAEFEGEVLCDDERIHVEQEPEAESDADAMESDNESEYESADGEWIDDDSEEYELDEDWEPRKKHKAVSFTEPEARVSVLQEAEAELQGASSSVDTTSENDTTREDRVDLQGGTCWEGVSSTVDELQLD
jgi:hypothetical protein